VCRSVERPHTPICCVWTGSRASQVSGLRNTLCGHNNSSSWTALYRHGRATSLPTLPMQVARDRLLLCIVLLRHCVFHFQQLRVSLFRRLSLSETEFASAPAPVCLGLPLPARLALSNCLWHCHCPPRLAQELQWLVHRDGTDMQASRQIQAAVRPQKQMLHSGPGPGPGRQDPHPHPDSA
jgi:hypothetical protein